MTDQSPSPEPQDAGPGDSQTVGERTIEALRSMTERMESGEPIPVTQVRVERTPDGPLTTRTHGTLQVRAREPAPTLLPIHRAEQLAGEFCKTWDGTVGVVDILAVITIASAACKIAAILIPLFMGTSATQGWFERRLKQASRKHFPNRSEVFHEQFAMELAEFICRMPDNGVSRGEVEAMLSELKGQSPQWNSSLS